MRCPECGAENSAAAAFCALCLVPFREVPAPSGATPRPAISTSPTQSDYSTLKALAFAHAAYGAVTAFFFVEPALISGTVGSGVLQNPASLSQEGGLAGVILILIGVVAIPGLVLALMHLALAVLLGLRRTQRLCAILAGVVSIGIPIGTVLGISTVRKLREPSIRELFERHQLTTTGTTNQAPPAASAETADSDSGLQGLPTFGPDRRFPDLSIWTVGPWILTWLLSFWLLAILIEPESKWGSVTLGFGKFIATHGYHPTYDRQALYATLITVALYTTRTFVLPRIRSRFKDRA